MSDVPLETRSHAGVLHVYVLFFSFSFSSTFLLKRESYLQKRFGHNDLEKHLRVQIFRTSYFQ